MTTGHTYANAAPFSGRTFLEACRLWTQRDRELYSINAQTARLGNDVEYVGQDSAVGDEVVRNIGTQTLLLTSQREQTLQTRHASSVTIADYRRQLVDAGAQLVFTTHKLFSHDTTAIQEVTADGHATGYQIFAAGRLAVTATSLFDHSLIEIATVRKRWSRLPTTKYLISLRDPRYADRLHLEIQWP